MNLFRSSLITALIFIVAAFSQGDYNLMKKGQPYAEAIVRDVSRDWNADKLIAAADPRMLKAFPEPDIRKMISVTSNALGVVKHQNTLAGQIIVETSIPGKTTFYVIELDAEKAKALVRIKIQKIGAQWKVLGFWVQLPSPHTSPTACAPARRW